MMEPKNLKVGHVTMTVFIWELVCHPKANTYLPTHVLDL